jgi:hypothetical protein
VTVKNTTPTPQPLNGLVVTGEAAADFRPTSTCWTRLILPNRTCTITVRFSPLATGAREAQLQIFDSVGTGPAVNLAGAGH